MTFDLGRLASIAILALVSSAVALEAPRTSDKAALAACLNNTAAPAVVAAFRLIAPLAPSSFDDANCE
jgi:hypothetical protein